MVTLTVMQLQQKLRLLQKRPDMCYDVFLNGFKLNTIDAKNEDEALRKAIYLYGMEVDVEEVTCKQQMTYN